MILALDAGNTQIYGGVFDGSALKTSFRKTSTGALTSDELGIFLKQALRENDISPSDINGIAVSSVVPDLNHTISNCARKYFKLEPFFIKAEMKTKLHIGGKPATGLGADRVANAAAAMELYAGVNLIVIDFGTANTYCAISKEGEYKGGTIQIGLGTGLNALSQKTALLKKVQILKPAAAAGMNTEAQLQAGVYFGNLGAMKEIISRFKKECFADEDVKIILTGGLGRLYENEDIIDIYEPDLVLKGIRLAYEENK